MTQKDCKLFKTDHKLLEKVKQQMKICGLDTKGKYSQRPIELDCGCGSSVFTYDDLEKTYICEGCGDVADDASYSRPLIF